MSPTARCGACGDALPAVPAMLPPRWLAGAPWHVRKRRRAALAQVVIVLGRHQARRCLTGRTPNQHTPRGLT